MIGMVDMRNNREINQPDSLSLDQDHPEFAIGYGEHDVFGRERFTAAATRLRVSLGKVGITRALASSSGLPSRPVSASRMAGFAMP